MEIRKVRQDEFEQCLEISEYAFQYVLPENERESRLKAMETYEIWGEFEEEKLISKVNVVPFQSIIANQTFSMGGVAGVATYPEKRRNGSVTRLLSHALKEMRQKGQVVSYLHPFHIGFYRRFGWENASDYKFLTLEKQDLRPIVSKEEAGGRVIRVNRKESISILREVFDQVKHRYNGLLERTDEWWMNNVHRNEQLTAVYVDKNDRPKGYLIYSIKDSECQIKEFMFVNEETRVQLWNFICQHDSMLKTVKIWTFLDDPIDVSLPVYKTVEVRVCGMVRIVDVYEFLKAFPFRKQLDGITLLIEDSFCEWNTGSYTFTNGSVSFSPTSSEELQSKDGLWMEIGTLSAIMVNYRTPTFFHRFGKIKGSYEDLKQFEESLSVSTAAVIDFF